MEVAKIVVKEILVARFLVLLMGTNMYKLVWSLLVLVAPVTVTREFTPE